jgi:hypothetical protein
MKRFTPLLLAVMAALVAALSGCASPTSTATPASALERMTPEQLAALKPVANPVLPLADVIALSKAGTTPADIIARLRDTQTLHVLSAQQIVDLGRQGVDQAVIDYMVDAQEKARQSRLLTELADRDAEQARKLDKARQRAPNPGYYGYGGMGYGGFGYGYPRYGWGPGYFGAYPFGRWR